MCPNGYTKRKCGHSYLQSDSNCTHCIALDQGIVRRKIAKSIPEMYSNLPLYLQKIIRKDLGMDMSENVED